MSDFNLKDENNNEETIHTKRNAKDDSITNEDKKIVFSTLAVIFVILVLMIVIGTFCYQSGIYGFGQWLFKVVEKFINWIILFIGIPSIFVPLHGKISDKLLAGILFAFLLVTPLLGYGVTRICENVIASCGQTPINTARNFWEYLWNVLKNLTDFLASKLYDD